MASDPPPGGSVTIYVQNRLPRGSGQGKRLIVEIKPPLKEQKKATMKIAA